MQASTGTVTDTLSWRPSYEEFVIRAPLYDERRKQCRLKEFEPTDTQSVACSLKAGHLSFCYFHLL